MARMNREEPMARKESRNQPPRRRPREYERIASRYVPPPPRPELKSAVCSICGRRRNVPLETVEEGFVCARCRED